MRCCFIALFTLWLIAILHVGLPRPCYLPVLIKLHSLACKLLRTHISKLTKGSLKHKRVEPVETQDLNQHRTLQAPCDGKHSPPVPAPSGIEP